MLYVASLKLVHSKGAKLLTDADGNDINDILDSDIVLDAFGNHVTGSFGLVDGKTSYLN